MSKRVFNPYRDMLDIPSLTDENPTDYQLLGVDDFESDPGKIAAAYEKRSQRIAELYQIITKMSQQIDDARDRVCDPNRKEEYDNYLLRTGRAGLARMGKGGACAVAASFVMSIVIVVVSTFWIYPMVVTIPPENIGDSAATLPGYKASETKHELDALKAQQEDVTTMDVDFNLPIVVDEGSAVDFVDGSSMDIPSEETSVDALPDPNAIFSAEPPSADESAAPDVLPEVPALDESAAPEETGLPEVPAADESAAPEETGLPDVPAADESAAPEETGLPEVPAADESAAPEETGLPEVPAADASAAPEETGLPEVPAADESAAPEETGLPEVPAADESAVPAFEKPTAEEPAVEVPAVETPSVENSAVEPLSDDDVPQTGLPTVQGPVSAAPEFSPGAAVWNRPQVSGTRSDSDTPTVPKLSDTDNVGIPELPPLEGMTAFEPPLAPQPPVIPELSDAPVSSASPTAASVEEQPAAEVPSMEPPAAALVVQTTAAQNTGITLEDVDQLDYFVQLGHNARTTADFARLITSAGQVEEALMKEKSFQKAQQIADVVYAACARFGEKSFRSEAYRHKELITQRAAWWEAVCAAEEKMKSNGTVSPAEALIVARWKIEIDNDWPTGLQYLAFSDNEQVRMAVKRDQAANSENVRHCLIVANDWWNLSQEPVPMQKLYRERACTWYSKALPSIEDKQTRTLIEKRISMANQAVGSRQ